MSKKTEEIEALLEQKLATLEVAEARLSRDEELAATRQDLASMAIEEREDAHQAVGDSREAESKIRTRIQTASISLKEFEDQTKDRVEKAYKPLVDPLQNDFDAKEEVANGATSLARYWVGIIGDKDTASQSRVSPTVTRNMQRETFDRVRNEGFDPSMGATGQETGPAAQKFMARKYLPFDRRMDVETSIFEDAAAEMKHALSVSSHLGLIDDTLGKLRQLYSPERNKLKINVDEGRLNPRLAYKVGLALKGVPVDLSKVWRKTKSDRDPKVAISLLLDCSGTMAGTRFELAADAATCLSEVMRQLRIPYEVVGHTTNEEGLKGIKIDPEELEMFSRILPFQGYVFKSFSQNKVPSAVYADFPMADNLDGEGVLWALKRLSARREHTKLCIVLTDGIPHAAMSKDEELERHLYTVVQSARLHEKDGLFVRGLGIGEDRCKEFFGSDTPIINDIAELPQAVLSIVESVLIKQVGTLG